MDINQEDKILIEQYLRDELPDNLKESFSLKLQTDEIFKRYYREMKIISSGIRNSALDEKLMMLKVAEKYFESELPIISRSTKIATLKWRNALSIAASVLLLACIVFYFYGNKSISEHDKLFAEFNSAVPSFVLAKSDNDNSDLKNRAYVAYESENYTVAFKLLKEVYDLETDTISLYFAGISALNINERNSAEKYFEICSFSKAIDQNELNWRKALLALRNGEIAAFYEMKNHLNR